MCLGLQLDSIPVSLSVALETLLQVKSKMRIELKFALALGKILKDN